MNRWARAGVAVLALLMIYLAAEAVVLGRKNGRDLTALRVSAAETAGRLIETRAALAAAQAELLEARRAGVMSAAREERLLLVIDVLTRQLEAAGVRPLGGGGDGAPSQRQEARQPAREPRPAPAPAASPTRSSEPKPKPKPSPRPSPTRRPVVCLPPPVGCVGEPKRQSRE